jgi:hypothetical protein
MLIMGEYAPNYQKHEYKLVEGEQNWNVEHPKGIEAFERDDHWPPIIIAQHGLE